MPNDWLISVFNEKGGSSSHDYSPFSSCYTLFALAYHSSAVAARSSPPPAHRVHLGFVGWRPGYRARNYSMRARTDHFPTRWCSPDHSSFRRRGGCTCCCPCNSFQPDGRTRLWIEGCPCWYLLGPGTSCFLSRLAATWSHRMSPASPILASRACYCMISCAFVPRRGSSVLRCPSFGEKRAEFTGLDRHWNGFLSLSGSSA